MEKSKTINIASILHFDMYVDQMTSFIKNNTDYNIDTQFEKLAELFAIACLSGRWGYVYNEDERRFTFFKWSNEED